MYNCTTVRSDNVQLYNPLPLAANAELHTPVVEAEEAVLAEPGGDGDKLFWNPDTGEMEPLVTVVTLDHVI